MRLPYVTVDDVFERVVREGVRKNKKERERERRREKEMRRR